MLQGLKVRYTPPEDGREYLRELLECDGVQEETALRSRFGFMAFHGGSLERHTDAIAMAAAEASNASVYVVRQPETLRWHIPSTLYRPQESEQLAAFVEHVDTVVTVHGYRRSAFPKHLLLGGRNRHLAAHLAAQLRPALPHFVIEDDLRAIPEAIRGVHPENPVNLPRFQGVQIELPRSIRDTHPFWETSSDLVETAAKKAAAPQRLVAALAAVAGSYKPSSALSD